MKLATMLHPLQKTLTIITL